MQKFNCIVIGAGNMGALKPANIDSPNSKNILTHAHAVKHNKDLKLLAIVEPNIDKQNEAFEKWDVFTYDTISQLYNVNDLHLRITQPVDIVCITSPTNTHFKVIQETIEYIKPKIIICEKPFCDSLYQAEVAIRLCEQNNIKLIVHYNRRYCHLAKMTKLIRDGDFGKVLSCTLTYKRGIKLTGCHAIDLFNSMFGEFIGGQIIPGTENSIADYSIDDLTYPVYLQYEKCKNVFMVPHDGDAFSVFDFRILTSDSDILITNHGEDVVINTAQKEKIYGNFKSLDFYNNKEEYKMFMKDSLINIYSECVNYLEHKEDFVFSSPATEAIKVHKIFDWLGV